ncbi:ABC transporter permease [Acidocella aminolytica]|jgi:spermidine/putrescine transport system permease protein|uniref:ABC transport system polyamine permease component PotC n=1 Tax=Acidocella aminolytica 101 = DSM 11237 TaxID=1120923 RepID=A0A0D6PJ10_9PROT|nr:ABC transporter permease [Acidocella aminolytica]GAN81730.1 ABC transport system polyamine permease component PotC [Acidocella aminolytica 101 = DSM 11237]GBQ38289.1 spermidine/putrescine ABC transporter permease [Acidocella aminolytica 101 = DSM 11237]SHF43909.1 spermidine/putrescine transport system permease protein [Acidocella aminolytica 101 = DSM 11237]
MSGAVSTPMPSAYKKSRLGERVLACFTWAMIIYTMLPIAVMVVFSFNFAPNGRVALNWLHFTFSNYTHAFAIQDLTTALVHSLEVAIGSGLISVILGTPLALALARHKFWGKTVTDIVIFADIAAPAVVVGASLLSLFLTLNLPRGLLTIFIAHVAFNLAFAVVVIRARVSGLDKSLDRAAADLGATPWVAFWTVIFPLILPGIIGAMLLCFMLSIDDLIITTFVAGQTLTFPLWVYGAVKVGTPPQVFVLSTFIFAGGVLLALVNAAVTHRRQSV